MGRRTCGPLELRPADSFEPGAEEAGEGAASPVPAPATNRTAGREQSFRKSEAMFRAANFLETLLPLRRPGFRLGGSRPHQRGKSSRDQGDRAQIGKSGQEVSRPLVEISDDERGEVSSQVADRIDETHYRSDYFWRQGLCRYGPEGAHRPVGAHAAEGNECKSDQQRVGNRGHRKQDATSSEQHGSSGVEAALMHFVRVTRDEEQRSSAYHKGDGVENSCRKTTQLSEPLQGAG